MTSRAPLAPLLVARVPAAASTPDLELRLQALWQAGRDAYPLVALDAAAFVAHLAERLPPGVGVERALAQLHAADLYLACACLSAVPGAVEALDRVFLAQVPTFLRRVAASAAMVDEVRQALREKLLLADGDVPPKLAGYSGSGALAAWLRVVAVRTALNLRRDEGARAAPEAALAESSALVAGADAELAYVRARYQADFAEALRDAIRELPARQRSALRLRFAHGMTDEKIAATFGVHQTTVTRWIASAREAVFAGTRRRLAERLKLEAADVESLTNVLRSRLDVSLTTLLGAGDEA